jgi:pimeloyl-ACP methyl ester carboxylesterase
LNGIADTMYPGKARAIGWYLAGRAFVLPEHDGDWLGEPAGAAGYTVMTDSNYRRAATRVLEEFDFRGLRERWVDLRQPVLLIWGTADPVIPFEISDSLMARIPCVRRLSLPALHRPQVEIPDTVAAEIARFSANPGCRPGAQPHEVTGVRH